VSPWSPIRRQIKKKAKEMNEKDRRKKVIRKELSAYLREDPDRAGDTKTQELSGELERLRRWYRET
jgi:hypothetical protein